MSEPKRSESVLKRGELMSTSIAAQEAFELLNAGTKEEFRGWGDTRTAARDRAAKRAGLTPAQGERLWKNWQTMRFPNGDVYRLLRNKYGHLCAWIENAADRIDREAREIEEGHAVHTSALPTLASAEAPTQGAQE